MATTITFNPKRESRVDSLKRGSVLSATFPSIVINDMSRNSSYYESEGEYPSVGFMVIWTKLASDDLTTEKIKAKELIDQHKEAIIRRNKASFVRSICSMDWVRRCACKETGKSYVVTDKVSGNSLQDERVLVMALSLCPYSDDNPIHWELLYSVYKATTDEPVSANIGRYGNHWEKIGFQALSLDKTQNFPFAVVGLNFTNIIIQRLRTGKLDQLADKEKTYFSVVNGIYRGVWLMFYRIWKSRNCTIKDFGHVLEEKEEMGSGSSHQLSSDELSSLEGESGLSKQSIQLLHNRFLSLARLRNRDTNELFIVKENFNEVKNLKFNPLGQRIVEAFFADADAKERLYFRDFVKVLAHFRPINKNKPHPWNSRESKLRFAFTMYDLDKSGTIAVEEFSDILKLIIGANVSPEQVESIAAQTMHEADRDGDGSITFEEFCHAMEKTDIEQKMSFRFLT
uniref:Calmodulin n=1 Tax=Rhabditophanes sp. KR3021 TaxID=114890 RepID=A0AC35TNK3_9BILA